MKSEESKLSQICNAILAMFVGLQMSAWFLMLHLSFYSIAYQIKSLSLLIDTLKPENKIVKKVGIIECETGEKHKYRLQMCGYLFNQISSISSLLNDIFSLPVLLILATLMMNFLTSLYFILYDVLIKKSVFHYMFDYFCFIIVINAFLIFVILQAADLPIKEVFMLNIFKSKL
jgi:hypothetical protein